MPGQADLIYEFAPFRLSREEHTLLRDGQPLLLAPKAFDLLLILIEGCWQGREAGVSSFERSNEEK